MDRMIACPCGNNDWTRLVKEVERLETKIDFDGTVKTTKRRLVGYRCLDCEAITTLEMLRQRRAVFVRERPNA